MNIQYPNFSIDKVIKDIKSQYHQFFGFYKPSEKQLAFHNAGNEAIERLFLAGNRTGKTYCGCIEDAMHLTGNYPSWWEGHRYDHPIVAWVASENYEITRNVLQYKLLGGYSHDDGFVEGLIHPSLIVKKAMLAGVNGAVDYVHVKHKSGGISSLYFKSYKQGREKFQGARCHLIHLDEEAPHDVFLECQMRLSDVDGKGQGKLILTMTPLKGYTQLMAYFLEYRSAKPQEDNNQTKTLAELMTEEVIKTTPEIVMNGKYYIQATWDDNPYLAQETKDRLRATLKPHELEAREKGIPTVGTGLVYQVPESDFVITMKELFEIPNHWAKVYGMDVGFFAPTAVVFLAIDRDRDIIYVYGEYSVSGLTASQHAGYLLPMGCNWMNGVCDPAVNQGSQRDGIRLLDEYKQVGMNIVLGKYAKELAVDKVLERIRTGRFKVFASCRKFLDEWRMYCRDEEGKIKKGNDHLMNALEFVMLDGLHLAKTKNTVSYQRKVVMF